MGTMTGGGGGIDPYLRRWMLFVDGENFTIRAQDVAQKKQIALTQGDFYLISGDGDYVPLVSEVKRLGKVVCVAFFEDSGLNPELRLSADAFADIGQSFLNHWQGFAK